MQMERPQRRWSLCKPSCVLPAARNEDGSRECRRCCTSISRVRVSVRSRSVPVPFLVLCSGRRSLRIALRAQICLYNFYINLKVSAKSIYIPTDPAYVCAIACYFPSISAVLCSTGSGHFAAARSQRHVQIIFPDALNQTRKGKQTKNMKMRLSWTILLAQDFLSENSTRSGSPNWLISNCSSIKQRVFCHKGFPSRVMFSPMTVSIFHVKCQHFVIVWTDRIWVWICSSGAAWTASEVETNQQTVQGFAAVGSIYGFCCQFLGEYSIYLVWRHFLPFFWYSIYFLCFLILIVFRFCCRPGFKIV